MSALAELVENAEPVQKRRDELVTRRDTAEAEFRKIVDGLRQESGEDRDPDEKETTRCAELRTEIDSTDETLAEVRKEMKTIRKRIKEETQRAKDKEKIAEARERIQSVDSIADVTVIQGDRPVYGVAPDGERSPNSFYMDLALRCKALFAGDYDHGSSKRLTEWAHQVEKEYAQRTAFGRSAEKQIRETIRGEDQAATAARMAEFDQRGRMAMEDKPELRATAIGTDGGASATAPGEGSAFVTPVFKVGDYAPYREFGE
jgi:hypothetical protein